MPTLYGPIQAGGEARIEIDYNVSYNTDKTSAFFSGSCYYRTFTPVIDNFNTWGFYGQLGSASGSNIPINHPSGGGRTQFHNFVGWFAGSPSIGASVAGVEAQGVTISAIFDVPCDALAPFTNGAYLASNIGIDVATVGGFSANGNGGTLNNTQTQYNTSASATGATTVTRGSYGTSMTLTGLIGGVTYYYRMRVANNTYGYGPWGPWKSFTTLPGIYVNVAGVWKHATPYVRVGGVWKKAQRFIKVGGVWKT